MGGIDNAYFGIRNLYTWTQLSAPRLAGWNHVEARIRDTDVLITINGEPTESVARNSTEGYGRAFIGSGSSNNTVEPFDGYTYVDNVFLGHVPEPATLSLLALGGLAMMRRRS